jgi:hypothetical protein
MFLEFNVSNYRSIGKIQTLSMAASKYYKGLEKTNTFDSKASGLPRLLRSAVIYGPNASGKSNLLRALDFMQAFVLSSHSQQEGQPIEVSPFALWPGLRSKPSEFEIFFIQDHTRYQYGFALTNRRVVKEWLLSFPEGKAQRWFERTYNKNDDNYKWYFGPKFIGRKHLWLESTRANSLFLSTAIQLNNQQLKPGFGWFQNRMEVILPDSRINLKLSIDQCASKGGMNRIMQLMGSADINISKIDIKETPLSTELIPDNLPEHVKTIMRMELEGAKKISIRFFHKDKEGKPIPFRFSDESEGTQKLFAFSGPWLNALEHGRTLFVDELNRSLHPLLERHLIGLFHLPAVNKNNAQIVFTTHDTTILDPEFFRRDQIWFIEKNKNQASKLYPLSDFSPRKAEALERGYLMGRYGAIPFIGEWKF